MSVKQTRTTTRPEPLSDEQLEALSGGPINPLGYDLDEYVYYQGAGGYGPRIGDGVSAGPAGLRPAPRSLQRATRKTSDG